MGVAVNVSLTLDNYQKLVDYSNVLGLSKSAIVNLLLEDPAYAYVLEFAYRLLVYLRYPQLRNR